MNINKFVYNEKQYPEEYIKAIVEAIKIMTIKDYEIIFIGSNATKALVYAADIDLNQKIPIKYHSYYLKQVINNLYDIEQKYKLKNYLIGDIKAGQHPVYYKLNDYIGRIENCEIINYRPNKIREFSLKYGLYKLYNIPDKVDLKKWFEIVDIINEYLTIRWTVEDIIKGFLIIDGEKLTLEDAIFNSPITKYDVYVFVNNKYIEVSNIFKDDIAINKNDLIKLIRQNMIGYIINKNYLKALKRLYSISKLNRDEKTLKKLAPLMISNINLLGSIMADLTTIKDILKFHSLTPIRENINIFINSILQKIYTVWNYKMNKKYIHLIKSLYNKNKEDIIKYIELINNYLLDVINKLTLEYMKKKNISFINYC